MCVFQKKSLTKHKIYFDFTIFLLIISVTYIDVHFFVTIFKDILVYMRFSFSNSINNFRNCDCGLFRSAFSSNPKEMSPAVSNHMILEAN